jgi:hypothetical protein
MRTFTIIFFTIIFSTANISVWAQSTKTLKAALPNYYNALNSNNDGVIESAIENLVKLKIHAPDLDFSKVTKRLDQLTEQGNTSEIKYKAFIAYLYLENTERFNWISSENKDRKLKIVEELFVKLEKQIKK